MILLVVGLVLFLGVHSVRIVADGWRSRVIAARGLGAWKGLYSLASVAGFVLIVVGFGQARRAPVLLWTPPPWTHGVAMALTMLAFILVAAAYVPGNGIKARLGDPMILGVKSWAFGHLLANGTLADEVLFGSVLVWSIFDARAARRRRESGAAPAPAGEPSAARSAVAVVAGIAAWLLFGFHLHGPLIGVSPMTPFH